MSKAVIIENIPYCANCEIPLKGGIENYYLAINEEGKHFAFTRKCQKCRKGSTYYTSTSFGDRYLIDEKE